MILSGFLGGGRRRGERDGRRETAARRDLQGILRGRHRTRMRRTGLRMRKTGDLSAALADHTGHLLLFIFPANIIFIVSHHRPTITNEPSLATTSPSTCFLSGNPTRFRASTSDRRSFKPSTKYKCRNPPTAGTPSVGGCRRDGRVLTARWSPGVAGTRARERRLRRFKACVRSYSGVL